PIIFASLLTDDKVILNNVPELGDVNTAIQIISNLGKRTEFKNNTLIISGKISGFRLPYDLVRRMRASFVAAGALLAKRKKACVSLPGGCAIGVRPINIHIDGFKQAGIDVKENGGEIILKGLVKPFEYFLPFPSVGATQNLIMCSVFVNGLVTLKNTALEPEIDCLIDFLNSMGAKIKRNGSIIEILGVKKLHGCEFKIIPDRIEAATYILIGAIMRSRIFVKDFIKEHLEILFELLKKAGVGFNFHSNGVEVIPAIKPKPISIETAPYPGFPTDLQAQWMTFMATVDGVSVIKENIFENRFMHVAELMRFGADIKLDGNVATVRGVKKLHGCDAMISDLRAGAALVMAGLYAKGITTLHRVYHIRRGYEKMPEKLRNLGATIIEFDEPI
ncbi:MAG: UDP-N-acetylglucosamine 1-carboxyvinyltransferase, partial [bacterium]|nr:UDP-N-acetylglucosamine 1-carboxyvinyltransferase [bacterium]